MTLSPLKFTLAVSAVTLGFAVQAQTPAPTPAPVEPSVTTVRICDDSGCSDRPRNSATFVAAPDENPEQARRLTALKDIAAQDPRAAYDLGMRLLRGDGFKTDGYQAIRWLREAGERGDVRAQATLGRLYLYGHQEMGSDPGEAERWLASAAERGDRESERLIPEARQARKEEHARYREREARRTEGNLILLSSYPYYWQWSSDRWVLY